ncbi:MAG: Hsp20/alpha crystallin family protein [Candidatus Methanomethylophilaceae archaeon]|jgi:HSP20 family protein|nr:Hsp20/alpha crystallin family protein [Candidatus Methanomethylophilaceae archaeon]NLF33354.1 Hsp20/alpha crystallin family protein [Thermoplasmatales archaeon]
MTDIWDDLFGGLDEFNKRMERMFTEISGPGVKTYGYTMYRGPDGVPHIREYGNAREERLISGGTVREPLTDVCKDGEIVRVVVELPGVSKEDIRLEGTESTICVSVDTPSKKFEKKLALPCNVVPDSAKAMYNNGILEITLNSAEAAPKGRTIPVE